MRRMWQDFGQKGVGYTEADYQRLAEEVAGISLEAYFQEMIFGTVPFEKWLVPALDYVGCMLEKTPATLAYESLYGFRLAAGGNVVSYISPDSPAATVLSVEDELMALNGRKLENNNLLSLLQDQERVELTLFRQKKLRTVTLQPDGHIHLPQYKVMKNPKANSVAQVNFKAWLKQDF
jgi:predicted metalloprotease with PDZ domain